MKREKAGEMLSAIAERAESWQGSREVSLQCFDEDTAVQHSRPICSAPAARAGYPRECGPVALTRLLY